MSVHLARLKTRWLQACRLGRWFDGLPRLAARGCRRAPRASIVADDCPLPAEIDAPEQATVVNNGRFPAVMRQAGVLGGRDAVELWVDSMGPRFPDDTRRYRAAGRKTPAGKRRSALSRRDRRRRSVARARAA